MAQVLYYKPDGTPISVEKGSNDETTVKDFGYTTVKPGAPYGPGTYNAGQGQPAVAPVSMITSDTGQKVVNDGQNFLDKNYPQSPNTSTPNSSVPNPSNPSQSGAPTGNFGGGMYNGKYYAAGSYDVFGNLTSATGPKAYFTNADGQTAEYTQSQLNDPSIQNFLKTGNYVLTKSDGFAVNSDFSTSGSSNGLQGEVNSFDNEIKDLLTKFQNYNVENDPAFQGQAQNIRNQYDVLRTNMERTNQARENSLKTLGYRTGSSQYAGTIQMGVLGEELRQADQRIADIANAESAALSAARTSIANNNYTNFSRQVDTLQKLRENKATELADYNKKLADANKTLQDEQKKIKDQEIQASRDSAIADLFNQGVQDVPTLLDTLNYNDAGKQIGDFTADEINKTLTKLVNKDTLSGLSGDAQTYEWLKKNSPDELKTMGITNVLDYINAVNDAKRATGKPITKLVNKVLYQWNDQSGKWEKAVGINGGGGPITSSNADQKSIQQDISAIKGGDGFLDTAKYQQIRENVAVNSPKLLSWFDKTYKPSDVLNPNDATAKKFFQSPSQQVTPPKPTSTNPVIKRIQEFKDAGYSVDVTIQQFKKAGYTDKETEAIIRKQYGQ